MLMMFIPFSAVGNGQGLPNEHGKYWAYFTAKKATQPEAGWLSPRCRARRRHHGFPVQVMADVPVNPRPLGEVSRLADSLGQVSRWLNAVGFWGNAKTARKVAALPGVRRIARMPTPAHRQAAKLPQAVTTDVTPERLRAYQVTRLQADTFRQKGLEGRGVRIAVFDAGFRGARQTAALQHLWDNDQVRRTRDFVGNDSDVFFPSAHGTMVLSCIAGRKDSLYIGLAPKAEFLLARTERLIWEVASEEDNWIAALEWAERHGADLVNSSLGYTRPRYRRQDMDGKIAPVSRAAGLAAKRGLLVVNSAGNEGEDQWRYIAAPADEDSVLSVGATSPFTDLRAPFSSFGPNANGEAAPVVTAPGIVAAAAGLRDLREIQGTSFSAPLVTGFAACLRQKNPGLRAMALHQLIRSSGHLHPYYDYELGHGVPQAAKALRLMRNAQIDPQPTFSSRVEQGVLVLNLNQGRYQKRMEEGKPRHTYVFYHVEGPDGRLRAQRLLRNPKPEIRIHLQTLDTRDTLRVHYEGFTLEVAMEDVP